MNCGFILCYTASFRSVFALLFFRQFYSFFNFFPYILSFLGLCLLQYYHYISIRFPCFFVFVYITLLSSSLDLSLSLETGRRIAKVSKSGNWFLTTFTVVDKVCLDSNDLSIWRFVNLSLFFSWQTSCVQCVISVPIPNCNAAHCRAGSNQVYIFSFVSIHAFLPLLEIYSIIFY